MKPSLPDESRPRFASRRARLTLVLAAAIFHVSVSTTVLMIGESSLGSGQFDQRGLGTFASDGFTYQNEVVELCGVLKNQGVVAWATWPTQLHVRLYSLPVAFLNGGTHFDILTIEPLNLFYYLTILILVCKLGEIVFNYRTGLSAAVVVAIWPSFLLHTTQLLRDPLLITAFLILMLGLTLCLKREYTTRPAFPTAAAQRAASRLWFTSYARARKLQAGSLQYDQASQPWTRGLVIGFAGAASIVVIRIVRLPIWPMLWAVIIVAVSFLIFRFIRQRRFPVGNVVMAIIMIATILITPRFQNAFHNQQVVKKPRLILPEEVQELPVKEQIAIRRNGFGVQLDPSGAIVPSDAGSDIDQGIQFNGTADIFRHIPRAAAVGFFSPFPNMWFGAGKQVGGGGRRLSGFETLVSYMIECLALFGLWRARGDLSAWFLFLVITLGAVALGLVVGNVGALYRLRYPFWTLLIIFGASGADYLIRRRSKPAGAGHGLTSEASAGIVHN
jgi:hypothetical protein